MAGISYYFCYIRQTNKCMWNCLNSSENQGAVAYLKGEDFNSNPNKVAIKYKDWCNGFRKAQEWNEDLKSYIKHAYNIVSK
jgi:hypothetical protein